MRGTARLAPLLIGGLLFAAGALAQGLYKYVGPDGRVVYSDRPPPDGRPTATLRAERDTARAAASAATAERSTTRGTPSSIAAPIGNVTLFTTSWCGYCRQAKAYLAEKGISYQEFDIETTQGGAAYAQAGGTSGVPLVVAGGQRIQGFSRGSYDRLFAPRR